MRYQIAVRGLAALGAALALGVIGAGCGGDDGAELTPEAAVENLEAAGYEGVELREEAPNLCEGFEAEISVPTDPSGKLIQGEVQFYETVQDAEAAQECVLKGVTKYYSSAADDQVYRVESLEGVTEGKVRLGALVSSAQGE